MNAMVLSQFYRNFGFPALNYMAFASYYAKHNVLLRLDYDEGYGHN